MDTLANKLSSRKFWMCIVAFFGSIATSIAALHSGHEIVAAIGIGCGIIASAASAVAYILAEGKVDAEREASSQTITNISASSNNTALVQQALTASNAVQPTTTQGDDKK